MVGLHLKRPSGHLGGDVRVAVPVAADPGAEPDRDLVGRQLDAEAPDLDGDLVEQVGHDAAEQLVEVVDDRACLVDGVGAVQPQLVGLPQQVHDLGEPALEPVLLVAGDPRIVALLEDLGDGPHLAQDGPPGGLRGVRREHGAQLEPVEDVADEVAVEVGVGEPGDRPVQRPARLCSGRELVDPVDLLGDVREVEVGVERAHELDRGDQVEVLEQAGELVRGAGPLVAACLLAQAPDLLDEVEEILALLAHDGLAEQPAEQPDVGSQGLVAGAVEGVGDRGLRAGHGAPPTAHRRTCDDGARVVHCSAAPLPRSPRSGPVRGQP